MNKRCIAIITARGGSKRIPHKNIKDFCGKPIIAYSIAAALESEVFEEVMVSTDDVQIAEIAISLGAKVPFMRSKLASDDFATTSDVLMEVLGEYDKMGKKFHMGCCLYPTAPFVTRKKIKAAKKLLEESHADTVLPIVAYSFPPQRAMMINNQYAVMQFPENLNKRSQDLTPIYHDCGQFYFFDVERFKRNGKLMSDRVVPMVVGDLEVQDIDNFEDWDIAEMKYRLFLNRIS